MFGRRASRLAPPRRIARGGSPPRCATLHPAPPPRSLAALLARAPLRAHRPFPVAVGRDVPIAPPRRFARGGSPPRCVALHPAYPRTPPRVPLPCAPPVPRLRAHRPYPVAVGRDVPIAPPRHRRGARLCIPRATATPHRPLSLAVSAPPSHPRITRAARWGHRALPPLHPRNSPRCRAPLPHPVTALPRAVPLR